MSRPGRDGFECRKGAGLKAKITTFPLASAPAVDHTVQAVYRPIKLDASLP